MVAIGASGYVLNEYPTSSVKEIWIGESNQTSFCYIISAKNAKYLQSKMKSGAWDNFSIDEIYVKCLGFVEKRTL